jgi:hypothetical protein
MNRPPPLPPQEPLPPPLIEYANARPAFLGLYCSTDAGHVRVWRDPPARKLLVREFIMPLITFTILGGTLIYWVYLASEIHPLTVANVFHRKPLLALAFLPWLGLLGYSVCDAWQNAGIVTEIDVGDGWFTWTKQTLFRTRTYRWKTDTIHAVRVRSVGTFNILKVQRHGGFPLGAFSRFRPDELQWAADALRAALNLSTN